MNRQALSRSERRMERKQVLLLLLLVVGVGLGCFALGVMVGRSATPQLQAGEESPVAPVRIPVAVVPPAGEPQAAGAGGATEPAGTSPNLTFYDNLPRGEQPPLGSGINLPPTAAEPAPAAPSVPAAATVLPSATAAPVRIPPPAPARTQRASAATGAYVVQVASFGRPDDAGVLQARLGKKGFEAYVQQVDLGSKGVWYRVFVGPLASPGEAEQVASRLKTEEKLSPLVRKR